MFCGFATRKADEAMAAHLKTGLPVVRFASQTGTIFVIVSEKKVDGFVPVRLERTDAEADKLSVTVQLDGTPEPPRAGVWRIGAYLRIFAEESVIETKERGTATLHGERSPTLNMEVEKIERVVTFTAFECSERTKFREEPYVTWSGTAFVALRMFEVPAALMSACQQAASKLRLAAQFDRVNGYDELEQIATAKPSTARPSSPRPKASPKPASKPAPQMSAHDRLDMAERSGRKRGGLKWKRRLANRARFAYVGTDVEIIADLDAKVDAAQAAVDEKFGAQPERKPDMALKAARTGDLPVLVVH